MIGGILELYGCWRSLWMVPSAVELEVSDACRLKW